MNDANDAAPEDGSLGPRPDALGLFRLEDICEVYLGMCFQVARREYAKGTLGVKAFRLNGRRRGPLFVHEDDLQNLIKRGRNRAAVPAVQRSPHAD